MKVPAPPVIGKCALMYRALIFIRCTAGGTGRSRSNKYAVIQLSDTAEKTSPFRSSRGNEMVATRMLQHQSEEVSVRSSPSHSSCQFLIFYGFEFPV